MEELDEALEIIRQIPSRESGEDGYVLILQDPKPMLAEAKGCSAHRAEILERSLKKRDDVKYVHHGGDKLNSGRRGHAWLVSQPNAKGNIQQQLDTNPTEGHPPEIVESERTFRAFIQSYPPLYALAQSAGQLRRELGEAQEALELTQRELDETRTERDEAQRLLGELRDLLGVHSEDEETPEGE